MTLTRVIIVMAAVAVPLLILLGWEGYKEAEYGGGALPAASDRVIHPSPEHLDPVVEVALQHGGKAAISHTVRLPYADMEKFSRHFANIAPTKGWYVNHASQREQLIQVVMPAKEIQKLTAIQEDPVGWVLAHEPKPGMAAKGPSSLDLVKVHLDLEPNDDGRRVPIILGLLTAWTMALAVGLTAGGLAITEVNQFIKRRRKSGHTPGENSHL